MRNIFLLPALALILCACGGSGDKDARQEGPSQRANGVIISESDKGQRNRILSAETAEFFDEAGFVTLEHPDLTFTNAGKNASRITANKGTFDLNKNLITLTGRVASQSMEESTSIKTEKIFYDTKAKKIWTNVNVTIIRAGVTVKAKGMRANGDFSEIEIFRQQTQLPKEMAGFEP